MNRKRFFTVFVAVAIAEMLIALPYESNAIPPIVVFGIGLAVGIGGTLLYNWLTDKGEKENVIIDDFNNLASYVNSYKAKMKDMLETTIAHWENFVNMTERQSLYWQRIAERKVIDCINKTTWDETIENYVCLEFDEYMANLTKVYLMDIANIVEDWRFELNGRLAYEPSDTNYKINVWIPYSDTAWDVYAKLEHDGNDWVHWYVNKVEVGVTGYSSNFTKVVGEVYITDDINASNIKDFYSTNRKMQFKVYADGGTSTWLDYCMFASTADYSIREHILGETGTYIFWKFADVNLNSIFGELKTVYNDIRNAMINSANAYWNYLHSLGYHNITDVPEDYIPVYPDVWLDDFYNLLNVTDYNESFALYYSLMQQLLEQLNEQLQQNNSEPINWTTLDIGNFTGKKANITLCEASATNGNVNVIVDADLCYVIPYQDLTLTAGKTYALTMNTTKPSWADELLNHNKLSIFDLETQRYYFITTDEITYYNLTVHQCYEGNQSKDSITINVDDAGKITYHLWGFGWQPFTQPHYIVTEDNSWLSWMSEHKGLVVIACIVLGAMLIASNRKGSGGYTLGAILLIVGIGLAFYWYILPTWNVFTSFWEKLTFWD